MKLSIFLKIFLHLQYLKDALIRIDLFLWSRVQFLIFLGVGYSGKSEKFGGAHTFL